MKNKIYVHKVPKKKNNMKCTAEVKFSIKEKIFTLRKNRFNLKK